MKEQQDEKYKYISDKMLSKDELIERSEYVLNRILQRVALVSPFYDMATVLRSEIRKHRSAPQIAKALRKNGYTIREIAKELGLKHPGSVHHILKKTK